jgi:hypothetical protein
MTAIRTSGRPTPARKPLLANFFRINTCESVSKQITLTIFRINTYEKQGEGGTGVPTGRIPDTAGTLAIACINAVFARGSDILLHGIQI